MINAFGLKEDTLPAVLPDSVKAQIVFAFTRFEVLHSFYAIASSTEEKSIELDFFSM